LYQYSFQHIFNYLVNQNKAFALWRMPSENTFHFLYSDFPLVSENTKLSENKKGFAIHPFNGTKLLIEASFYTNTNSLEAISFSD
jgi:hypothetical protein